MSVTVLLMATDTRLLIETAIELHRNAKKLIQEAKASARELNYTRQLSRQLQQHAYNRKRGERTAVESIIVTTL
jgi:hypothetical protein